MKKIRKGTMIIIDNNIYLKKEAKSWEDFSGEKKDFINDPKNRTIVILNHNIVTGRIIATSTTSGKKNRNGEEMFYPKKWSFHQKEINTFIKYQVIELDYDDIKEHRRFRRLSSIQLNVFLENFKIQNSELYEYLEKKIRE